MDYVKRVASEMLFMKEKETWSRGFDHCFKDKESRTFLESRLTDMQCDGIKE